MLRRPLWLGTGVALGAGGALWLEQRLRRALRDLAPNHAVKAAAQRAGGLGERVWAAGMAATEEKRRHETQLRARMAHAGRHRVPRQAEEAHLRP